MNYPRPDREGFRDYIAPGFAQTSSTGGQRQDFELTVESVNGTGWRALKKRLRHSRAHVLLGQETWVTQEMLPAASAWAKARGWKAIWAPATKGEGGGPSAGVAVFARDWLGLRHPQAGGHIWHHARAVAAVVEAPGFRPMVVVSCYLHGAGPDQRNLGILADVGAGIRAQGADWMAIVGGDLNMAPETLAETGFDREVEASIMYPLTERGTFRTSTSASLIDYFLVSDRMAAAVARISTIEASGIKGHVPVEMVFKPRVTALKALHLRRPPELPTERIYGPVRAPPSWERARAAAEEALSAARAGSAKAEELLEEAYRLWANTAEEELEEFTGVRLKKRGLRGAAPSVVWRSVVPERRPAEGYPTDSALQWLRSVIMELQRIGQVIMTADADDGNREYGYDGGDLHVDDDCDADADDGAEEDGEHGRVDATGRRDGHTLDGGRRKSSIERCRRTLGELATSVQRHLPEGEIPEQVAMFFNRVSQLVDAAVNAAAAGEPADATGTHNRIDASTIDACARDAGQIREELEAALKQAEDRLRAQDNKDWRQWIGQDIDKGAARAHAYSRLPNEWLPTVAKTERGNLVMCT